MATILRAPDRGLDAAGGPEGPVGGAAAAAAAEVEAWLGSGRKGQSVNCDSLMMGGGAAGRSAACSSASC